MSAPKVTITLTAYNMGPDATEADFDSFAAYVAEHVGEQFGVNATVDQFTFSGSGESEDVVTGGASEETDAAIRAWLKNEAWDAWCSQAPAA